MCEKINRKVKCGLTRADITGVPCHGDTECADRIVHSTEITGVPCHGDTECADGIVYSLHRLLVVGATEIQNVVTGLYTLYRDYWCPVPR